MENKMLFEKMEKFLEMSGTFLEQAYAIREMVNTIESEKATAELNNKLIRIKARENWANAEARYYRVLADDITTAHTGYDVHGKVVIDVMSCPNCRAPVDWEHIWKRVAHRLHQYHKRLTLQQFYGRNPKDVAMFTPKVIVEKE